MVVVVVFARCRYGEDRAAVASSCAAGWCWCDCGCGCGGRCVCSCGVADFQRAPNNRNDARTERLRCRPADAADAAVAGAVVVAAAADVGPDDDDGVADVEFNSADKRRWHCLSTMLLIVSITTTAATRGG